MKIFQHTEFEFDEGEVGLWLNENTRDCPRTAKMDQIQRVLVFNLSKKERKELVKRLSDDIR